MTAAHPNKPVPLPALPHWEESPDDLHAAIVKMKQALRARIEASARTVDEVFAVMEARVHRAVDKVADAQLTNGLIQISATDWQHQSRVRAKATRSACTSAARPMSS